VTPSSAGDIVATVSAQQCSSRARYFSRPIFLLLLATGVASGAVALASLGSHLFPGSFQPVVLTEREALQLEDKLLRVKHLVEAASFRQSAKLPRLADAKQERERTIAFSERELNALLSRNTELAARIAIDLSAGAASARVLIPVDPAVPLIGGRRVRCDASLVSTLENGRPRVTLTRLSVLGLPLPTAWLGDLKNVDLIQEAGNPIGSWEAVADALELVELDDDRLKMKINH
jgi:hypothetical protein